MPLTSSNISSANSYCFHCGDSCNAHKVHAMDKIFCCDGCKSVYEILQGSNLCNYYQLNHTPGISQKTSIRKNKFLFLDNEEIKTKLIRFAQSHQVHINFYLPQIHCSSCLWLLEHIHEINTGIISCTVNFSNKEVFIVFNDTQTSLRKVVETLAGIGYEPHLSLQDMNSKTPSKTNRQRLIKIGVAGFCFSNIMMLSFPVYLANGKPIEPIIHTSLQVISMILSLPVLLYAAREFFVSAWNAIKHKYLNIDAPVVLAILITFIRSVYEILSRTGNGYLDSMSGIVFFMLVGRWLQERTYQNISFDRDFKSFFPIAVDVIINNKVVSTAIEQVKVNDIIQVYTNELVPVDGILSKGNAAIDYSFVSGENVPVHVNVGEIIYAGGKQLNGRIELLVVQPVSQSYLTNLWNNEAFKRKAIARPNVFDNVGKYFTYIVLIVGAIAAGFWSSKSNYHLMWNALTTVLIVACPCALLLASNYANGNILKIFGLNKLYLRDASVIEQMSNINHIVFDKTGTLTQGNESIVIYNGKSLNKAEEVMIASVLAQSQHPLSKIIFNYLNAVSTLMIEHYKETIGEGIEAWVNEQHIKIGSAAFVASRITTNSSTVFVKFEHEIIGYYEIKNKYRSGIFNMLMQLKKGYQLSVISGDNDTELPVLQKVVGDKILFHQTPADKFEYIQQLQFNSPNAVMMVGDGLNDAGALKISHVGIAITDAINNFTPACDGIADAQKLNKLDAFLSLAKASKYIIFLTFSISAIYNLVGLWFAVQGILSPVIAAILMPLSSFTIILLTYGLTQIIAKKQGLLTNISSLNQLAS